MDIAKKWCTYGCMTLWGFGKIVRDSSDGGSVFIQYSEGQLYSPECWDPNPSYVQRFDTLTEALEYFAKRTGYSIERVTKWGKQSFPSEYKEK